MKWKFNVKNERIRKFPVLGLLIIALVCFSANPFPFSMNALAAEDEEEDVVAFLQVPSETEDLTLRAESGEDVLLRSGATEAETDAAIDLLSMPIEPKEPVRVLVSFTAEEIAEYRDEQARIAAEEERIAAEKARIAAEQARIAEEQARAAEEEAREAARKQAKEDFISSQYANSMIKEVPSVNTSFKSYMGYKTITLRESLQYKIEQDRRTYTDEYGFRRLGDYYLVALGSYYGKVGDTFRIVLEDGTEFMALTGDLKANAHTDAKNQIRWSGSKANLVEFIVDPNTIGALCRRTGDMGYANDGMFRAGVKEIYRLPSTYATLPEVAFY